LERVEVYQATGVIVAALDVSPADALVRLRAHAISRSLTASEVAYQILDRRLALGHDDWHDTRAPTGGLHECSRGRHRRRLRLDGGQPGPRSRRQRAPDQLAADCARLLDVTAVGLLLADPRGALHVVAASSDRVADLEAFQAQRGQGPCHTCYLDGAPVNVPDLEAAAARWPDFAAVAAKAGVASVHAVPMRLRDDIVGLSTCSAPRLAR
jgi:hypothetical protein